METTLVVNQKQHFKIAPVDAEGVSREVSNPQWVVLEGDASVEVDADGLGATVIPSDTPGSSVIEVSADADLTEGGVVTLSETINLTTTAVPLSQATSLGLTADEPVTK